MLSLSACPLRVSRWRQLRWISNQCTGRGTPLHAILYMQRQAPDRASASTSNPRLLTTRYHATFTKDASHIKNRDDPPTTYRPPETGLISKLPASWIPYAELIRLDKPAGTYYLYFPCLFSTLLAAPLANPISTPIEVVSTAALFFAGAIIMRGAGCTINDLWDRNLDPHVERTRLRPIARKAITPQKAIVYVGFQLLTGLAVLLQFPTSCLYYGIPSLMFVATYPLAKRVTNYPQFVLGLTFSWGAMMGFPALGVDLLADQAALASAAALYASCVTWTLNYDMIYAFMDIRDDANAGIKSIARAHDHNAKAVLYGLSVAQVGLLAVAGYFAGAGPIFFVGSCGGAAVALGTMIRKVNLRDVKDCWWWFKNGAWLTGGTISLGLLGDYLYRRSQIVDLDDHEQTGAHNVTALSD